MKRNYFEYIVMYLSVLLVCVLIGVVGRSILIGKGADEYTAKVVFWLCIGAGIFLFALINLLLDPIVRWAVKYVVNRSKSKSHKNQISDENLEAEKKEQEALIKPELPEDKTPDRNIEQIREQQQTIVTKQQQAKIDVAIHYTQKTFALYTTDEDLKLLCDYVMMYAQKLDLENIKPIAVKDLSNLDLYHFGWNLWNHFKPIKQEEVSKLLKTTFFALKEIELDSIKSHLKDDPKKGIVKITDDLSGL